MGNKVVKYEFICCNFLGYNAEKKHEYGDKKNVDVHDNLFLNLISIEKYQQIIFNDDYFVTYLNYKEMIWSTNRRCKNV
jgi:hypothetical protein